MRITPLLLDGDIIVSATHTSGSTSSPVFRYRSLAENRLVAEMRRTPTPSAVSTPRPLGLDFYAPFHGQRNAVDVSGPYIFTGAVWEDHFIRAAIATLRRAHHIPGLAPRVTFVHGSVRLVRILTQALVDEGVDSGELAVRSLGVYGGYLSAESRGTLERYWGVPVLNRFSMSEFTAGAAVCPRCGALKFDAQLLPELREEEVEAGSRVTGELLLTDLFPHSYCQPLIRYRTGDLVEQIAPDTACSTAHVGLLRHVGRRAYSLGAIGDDGRFQLALGSSEIREALYCEHVAKSLEMPHLEIIRDRRALGHPLGSARLSDDGRVLYVAFRPAVGVDADAAVAVVRDRLLGASSTLFELVRSASLELAVVADVDERTELHK